MTDPVRLLILGTGTVGASIGLAFRRAGAHFDRIGYDPRPPTARGAHSLGAVDRIVSQPGKVAPEADLVLLTLPPHQAIDAAAELAGRLRPETVVVWTFRSQSGWIEAVRGKLGVENPFLGAAPFLGPVQALAQNGEPGHAAADAFDGGMLGIAAPAGTSQGTIEIALDLAAVLGATPFFLDPIELDSVAATSDQLPALLAAALLESLAANPGWRDQQRLVGPPFARLAGLLEGRPTEVAAEWIANRGSLLARVDALADELGSLRDLLAAADETALAGRLEAATARYQEWRLTRSSAAPDHGVQIPDVPRSGLFERLMGGGLSRKKT